MGFNGMWKMRFNMVHCKKKRNMVRLLSIVLSAVLVFTGGAIGTEASSDTINAGMITARTEVTVAASDKEAPVRKYSPHILDCGRSPDGYGTYVLYSGFPGTLSVFNPGLQYAIEYDCSVRKDPSSGREVAEDLQVHVFDTRSGWRLYSADISRMLQEVRRDYKIGFPDGGFGIRISETGKEYLALETLWDTTTGKRAEEEIELDLETGELVLKKETPEMGKAPIKSWERTNRGIVTKSDIRTESAWEKEIEKENREIRERGWLSTLYTNLLEMNGYIGTQAFSRPSCFVLGISQEETEESASIGHLLDYYSPADRKLWEEAAYIVCVFDADQGVSTLIQALFGSPDNICWEEVRIYAQASWDGSEHRIRSAEEFYWWYGYNDQS